MRIVIDIPDWRYKSICKGIESSKRCGVVGPDPVIQEAIYKGTPLPKGHGDLVTKEQMIELVEFYQINPQHFDFVDLIDEIKDEKPIVEADKEGEAE